jgi:hypothetical protein
MGFCLWNSFGPHNVVLRFRAGEWSNVGVLSSLFYTFFSSSRTAQTAEQISTVGGLKRVIWREVVPFGGLIDGFTKIVSVTA